MPIASVSVIAQREANPVLVREVRARWRSNRSFFVVFGYTLALALLAYFNYRDVAENRVFFDTAQMPTHTSLPGRDLFLKFNQWQMAGWLILSPLLTAGAIAGERERGLLENLLLAPLTKRQIVHGKWLSALALVALLLLVPLPVAAICFPLGGLSPHEFVATSLFQASTVLLGATVGLWSSAKAPRLNEALSKALINTWWWGWTGPLVVLPNFFAANNDGSLLIVAIGLQSVATVRLLNQTVWQLGQPVEERRLEARRTWMDAPDARPMTLDIGMGEPQSVTAEDLYGQNRALDDPERYKRWDMPGAERLRFENPVLQREVRVHLRLRAQHMGARPGSNAGCALSFAAFNFFLYFLAILADSGARAYFWGIFSTLWLLGAGTTGAVLGSSAFTRERAAGMLEFLLLTCLKPHEILWGKISGAVVVVAYYSLALIPALLPCVVPRFDGRAGLTGGHMLGTLLLVLSTTWAAACWGTLVSWLCRQNFVATAIALLGIICFPYLPGLSFLNPLAAQGRLQPAGYFSRYQELQPWTARDVFAVPIGLFLLGLLFTAANLRLLRRDPRQSDR